MSISRISINIPAGGYVLCGTGLGSPGKCYSLFPPAFEERGAAVVLSREKANSKELLRALEKLLSSEERRLMSENCAALVGCGKPSEKIAEIVYTAMFGGS